MDLSNRFKDLTYELKIDGLCGIPIRKILRDSLIFCLEKDLDATMEINQVVYKINIEEIMSLIKKE